MSKKKLEAMTKAKLIEYIESLQDSKADPTADVEDILAQNRALMEQNQQLMAALLSARNASDTGPNEDNTLHKVTNVSGMTLIFSVNDSRGLPKTYRLEKSSDVANLTKSQIEELREKAPVFFDKGYLSIPSLLPENNNVIVNIDKFIDDLEYEDINNRIESIDSVPTLFSIYNHIQTSRFTHLDEQGNPLVEKDDDGSTYYVMREVNVSAKTTMVETAVQKRIAELTGIRVKRDAGE